VSKTLSNAQTLFPRSEERVIQRSADRVSKTLSNAQTLFPRSEERVIQRSADRVSKTLSTLPNPLFAQRREGDPAQRRSGE